MHPFWEINFVHRHVNFCVHNIAAWARANHVSGKLDIISIPPTVLYNSGGTHVTSDEDDPLNA